MKRLHRLLIVPVAALTLAACGDVAPTDGAGAERQDRVQADAVVHSADGTLNSFDAVAGTVNISHGAVASADWPAMTMTFKLADPQAAADIEEGAQVRFRFTVQSGMSATVTEISAAD